MDYEDLKEQLKAKLGNHCYMSNALSCGSLICFAISEKADSIMAEVLPFKNDSYIF